MTTTHRAPSRRARALAAVLAVAALVLAMVAWLGPADAAPTVVQATYAREGQTCTTTAAGYCTVNHGLGTAPEWVGITNSGVALTGVDGKTSATFRVRFAKNISNNGTVTPYANVPVRFDWAVVYTPPEPEPTTQPPTSPPATTTEPPPTTTAPATTTPAPTTTVPAGACMPDPSACGWPDVETTGVLAGVARQAVSGTVTLSTAGQVYENKTVTGEIVVTAKDVTIRNVQVRNNAPWYVISVKSGGSWDATDANLLLEHVELDLGGNLEIKGIAFNGYTVRSSFIHNGSDCAHFGVNVTITDSLCVSGPDVNGDGWPDAGFGCQDGPHYDGFQSDGGRSIVLRHNTIRNPCGQTSAILMSSNTSAISGVTIADNLMGGGGYTLYCNAGPDVTNETVTGNRFSRRWYPQSGYWGPTTGCEDADTFTGNRWDDTGVLLGP